MFSLRTLRGAGGAAMLLLLLGCQTNPVLIINPHAGIEGSGAHCMRMRFGRLVPDYETGASTAAHSVTYRIGERSIQGERQVVSVKLPFTAVNDTDAPWVVDSSMFEFARTSDHEKFVREGSDFAIAVLPPRSHNRFDVLFRVEAPMNFDKTRLLTCCYRLDVVDRAGPERLLQKELSLAEVSQPAELVRLAVVVVGAIVLIGVL
ncbi:MAG TPA: hypothetical protein VFD82_03805 [Planctomycetota bacterium]|nr:hypothetical protein [Planctomycetota bacterium]